MSDLAFKSFEVTPTWGEGSAEISWIANDGLAGNVYLYRSEHGLPSTWKLLTTTPQPLAGSYIDDTVSKEDKHAFHFYRGIVAPNPDPETWIKGDSVSALSTLTRREHFLLKAILRREWRDMRRGNGLLAWHCIPKVTGEDADNVEPVLGMPTSKGCEDNPAFGFGQYKAGGFYPVKLTRIRFLSIGAKVDKNREDATGVDQDREVVLRLMAFPRPNRGDMFVLPESDRRYVLKGDIQPFWFKAEHPIAWECRAVLIDRRDPRHLFEVPPVE